MGTTRRPDKYEQVEGRNPVREAVRGRRKVKRIFLAKGVKASGLPEGMLSEADRAGIPVVEVPRGELDEMSGSSHHQGVVAWVTPFDYESLGELLESLPGSGRVPLLLALDAVEDPRNFGALLRVADAGGVQWVITTRRRSCPVTPAVARASAGAVEHVRIARVPNLPRALGVLKENGFWVVGADAEGEPCWELDFTPPVALVMGSEGGGLGRLVGESCDMLAAVPMTGKVGSLNVSTAGGLLVYEVMRQRRAAGDP